jgi:DNA-binding response OmpR family regulator
MMLPLVLIHERERRLAQVLREPASQWRWLLREPRRPEQAVRLLQRRGPGVVILQVAAAPEKDLLLLQRLRDSSPESGMIVVLEREIPQLAALVWDLGAHMVYFAPAPVAALVETTSLFLRSLYPQMGPAIPLAEPDEERTP